MFEMKISLIVERRVIVTLISLEVSVTVGSIAMD